jgi:hypothetical protein
MSLFDNNLINIYKSMVGLFNVDNTSDLNKPISIATQTALDSKLNLTGGTLVGGLTGTTANFSGDVVANEISVTTLNNSKLNLTGGTLVGGLTGTTASFSGPLVAIGGLTGTTATFSGPIVANGGLTGTTASFSGALVANGGLTGTTASFSADLTVLGRIFCSLPNHIDNTAAKNAGIPIGALYRTGGIIKIRLDDIPPVITLNGNASMNVSTNNQYSEPGITITDNINLNLTTSVISILKDSVELLTAPITVSNTSSYITYVNDATYSITYLGKDDAGNLSTTLQRTVNVIMPFTMSLSPMTISNFDAVYSSARINSMVYTNGTYMAAYGVTIDGRTYPSYLTSTDGINWSYNNYFVTYFSPLAFDVGILNLAAANNIFVICITRYSNQSVYTFSSNDNGVSWTLDNSSLNIAYNVMNRNSLRGVGNFFFYNLYASPYTGFRSSDGLTWTQCTGTRTEYYTLYAYGNGIYVAASRAGNVITSTDGLSWTSAVALSGYVIQSYEQVRNIAFGNGKFILTNYDTGNSPPTGTNYILYSTNGVSWTRVDLPYYNNQKLMGSSGYIGISSIYYVKNKFVMGLYDSLVPVYIFTSPDGISWNVETFTFTKNLADLSNQRGLNNKLFYPVSRIDKIDSSYYPFFIN